MFQSYFCNNRNPSFNTITLNIRYDFPEFEWSKITQVYQEMDGWKGFGEDGCPYWFGHDGDPQFIFASVEPSGLLVEGQISDDKWEFWIKNLQERLSSVLGFKVCDAEE